MDFLTIGDFNFLIFIIPGFTAVWAFRYFTNSKKQGGFEYLGLSFVWGLITLPVTWMISNIIDPELFAKLDQSPYAASLILSVYGFMIGWVGSRLIKWSWFRWILRNVFLKK